MPWTSCDRQTIVIHTYTVPPLTDGQNPQIANRRIPLSVGDIVRVTSTNGLWGNGTIDGKTGRRGIFPMACVVDVKGREGGCVSSNPTVELTESHERHRLSNEIVHSLKRAWPRLQDRYVNDGMAEVNAMIKRTNELMTLRLQVIDARLPRRQFEELRIRIARNLDMLFRELDMPIVVRNAKGQPIHAERQSIVDLHKCHASGFTKHASPSAQHAQSTPYCVLLKIHAVQQRTLNDVECTFALYDFDEWQFVSEPLTLLCKKHRSWERAQLCALFGDLTQKDMKRENLLLVVRVARIGPIETTSSTLKGMVKSKLSSSTLGAPTSPQHSAAGDDHWPKQPFAIAALEISSILPKSVPAGYNPSDIFELASPTSPISPCIKSRPIAFFLPDNESLESSIKKAVLLARHPTNGESLNTSNVVNQSTHSSSSDLNSTANLDISNGDSTLSITTNQQCIIVSMQTLRGKDAHEVHAACPQALANVQKEVPYLSKCVAGGSKGRNELFLTLESAELSQSLENRNIEVAICLIDQSGAVCKNSICTIGDSRVLQSGVRSVVVYHDSKPRWMQQIKILLPADDLANYHLRFLLRHRSKDNHKDKKERTVAMAYLRLARSNGPAVVDGVHDLLIFHVDTTSANAMSRASSSSPPPYVDLPCDKDDLLKLGISAQPARGAVGTSNGGIVLCNKDSLRVRTQLCSDVYTHNVDVYNILHHTHHAHHLRSSLTTVVRRENAVLCQEIVKFLPHLLDVLFALIGRADYESLAFDGIVSLTELVCEQRSYQGYKSTLLEYIDKEFGAYSIYPILLTRTTARIRQIVKSEHTVVADAGDRSSKASTGSSSNNTHVQSVLKVMPVILRIVVRAREIEQRLSKSPTNCTPTQLVESAQDLLSAVGQLMNGQQNSLVTAQAHALKYLPESIIQFAKLLPDARLTQSLTEVYDALDVGRLPSARLDSLAAIVDGGMFDTRETRETLLPFVLDQLTRFLTHTVEREFEKCAAVLLILFGRLWHKSASITPTERATASESEVMIGKCQRPIMHTLIKLFRRDRNDLAILQAKANRQSTRVLAKESRFDTTLIKNKMNETSHSYISLLVALMTETSARSFDSFLASLPTYIDRHDYLLELLLLFADLISNPRYPQHWHQQRMCMNRAMRNMLTCCAASIKTNAERQHYDERLWMAYFTTATQYVTQDILHVERLECAEREELLQRYGELRSDVATDMRSVWFSMYESDKICMGVSLLGCLLRISLVGNGTFVMYTVPVLVDMMLLEYDHIDQMTRQRKLTVVLFEREMVDQLDTLVDEGWGDESFTRLFIDIVHAHIHQLNTTDRVHLAQLITSICGGTSSTVSRLLKRLFEYRRLRQSEHDCHITRMNTLVNLAELYHNIGQRQLEVKYTYKLHDLHLSMGNFTGAAFALLKHAAQLNFVGKPIEEWLIDTEYSHDCEIEQELKARLMDEVVHLFEVGEQWERALHICAELQSYHEHKSYDYIALSNLLTRMALMYEKIATKTRLANAYFLVKFIGNGFPPILANRNFVCRGKPGERLSDFNETLILDNLPNAQLLTSLDADTDELREGDGQFLQIINVLPIIDDDAPLNVDPALAIADLNIRSYHKYNNVQKFEYSRKSRRTAEIECLRGNEFGEMWIRKCILVTSYALPGLLPHFPVTSQEAMDIPPLQVAVEMVRLANINLSEVIDELRSGHAQNVQPLQMKLNGMLNPAVQGGLDNYNCFFCVDFAHAIDDDLESQTTLADLGASIADQVVRLEYGVYWHARRCTPQDTPMHDLLLSKLVELKAKIEAEHGSRPSLLPAGASLVPQFVAKSYTLTGKHRRGSMGSQSALQLITAGGSTVFHDDDTQSSPSPSRMTRQHSTQNPSVGLGFRSPLMVGTAGLMGMTGSRHHHQHHSSSRRISNISSVSSGDGSASKAASITVLNQELTPSRPPRPPAPPKTPSRTSLSHLDSVSRDTVDTTSSGATTTTNESNKTNGNYDTLKVPPPATQRHSDSSVPHNNGTNGRSIDASPQRTSTPIASPTTAPPPLTTRRPPPPVPCKPHTFV